MKCPYCNKDIQLDPTNNENEEWIQCPHCDGHLRNPFFRDRKEVDYIK